MFFRSFPDVEFAYVSGVLRVFGVFQMMDLRTIGDYGVCSTIFQMVNEPQTHTALLKALRGWVTAGRGVQRVRASNVCVSKI